MTNTEKLACAIYLKEANSALGTAASFVPGIGGLLSGLVGERPHGATRLESGLGQTVGGMGGGHVGGFAGLLTAALAHKLHIKSPTLTRASILGGASLGTAAGTGLTRYALDKNNFRELKE